MKKKTPEEQIEYLTYKNRILQARLKLVKKYTATLEKEVSGGGEDEPFFRGYERGYSKAQVEAGKTLNKILSTLPELKS